MGFTKTNIFLTDTVQEVVDETEEGHEAQQMTTHERRRLEHSNFDKHISHNSSL